MAGITHHKVATLADDPSAEVGKDEWNEAHDLDDITSLPTAETDATKVLAPDGAGGVEFRAETGGGGGGGAPTTADYLVGTAQAGLSAEIVVGATPGGELGGTWASPTVDATHSGSAHHDAVTVGTGLDVTGQLVELDLSEVAAGGELGGFMDAPTVDSTHSGSTHAGAAAAAVTTHEGLSDPHTGYRLESADHTHASTGIQGGTIAYSAITGTPAAERAAASTTPANVGTAAVGVGTTDARADHVHATGAGTPSTQAFGDAAATGTGPAAAMTDHKHAMPAAPTAGTAILLNYDLASDVSNQALSAATAYDIVANQNFTVLYASSLIEFSLAGSAFVNDAASTQIAVQIVIDSAGTPITKALGAASNNSASVIYRDNPFAGNSPVYISGLAAGVHTVKVQVISIAAEHLYCRASTNQPYEFLRLQVIEHKQ